MRNAFRFGALAFVSLVVVAVLSVGFSGCSRRDGEVGINPGDKAPQVRLVDLDGQPKTLGDFHGKQILLNFWASWCAPCVAEMPYLEALSKRLAEKDFVVVTVGVEDSAENLRKVQKRYGLSLPILVDQAGASKKAFRLNGFPESFFLDREGRVMMVIDPDSGDPVTRIVGPREWTSTPVISLIENSWLRAN